MKDCNYPDCTACTEPDCNMTENDITALGTLMEQNWNFREMELRKNE